MARGGKAGKNLRGRNKARQAQFKMYDTQNRFVKNKVKKLEAHLRENPDDEVAKQALTKALQGKIKPRSGRKYRKEAAYEYDNETLQKELARIRREILRDRSEGIVQRSPFFRGAARVF